MINKVVTFVILILWAKLVAGQSVNFCIANADSTNRMLEIAHVTQECKSGGTRVGRIVQVVNGTFSILLMPHCDSTAISVSFPGFTVIRLLLCGKNRLTDTSISVFLTPEYGYHLEPVIVSAIKPPITIQNDTTTYTVRSFSDGTERKLEDVLRKMPGIEVNRENGEIRFKGRPIETILVDGDNLFGGNYNVAARNISPDLVTEVQAIENFSENYVLKGIEGDEKVALNLKFKESKSSAVGGLDLSLGKLERGSGLGADLGGTLVTLNDSYKSFSTLTYNNVGINRSTLDANLNTRNAQQTKDNQFKALQYINDPTFTLPNDFGRSTINSQLGGSHNTIVRPHSKLSLKLGSTFYSDRLKNDKFVNTDYTFNGTSFNTFENESRQKTVSDARIEPYLRFAISSKSLFEISYSAAKTKGTSVVDGQSNFLPRYQTRLLSNLNLAKTVAIYTQRLGTRQALQIEYRTVKSKADQYFDLRPSVVFASSGLSDTQLSISDRRYTHLSIALLAKHSKVKYSLSIKGLQDETNYCSELKRSDDSLQLHLPKNNVTYARPSFSLNTSAEVLFKGLKITSTSSIRSQRQSLSSRIDGELKLQNQILIDQSLKFRYALTPISNVSLVYTLVNRDRSDRHFFRAPIIQSFRTSVSNIPAVDFIKENSLMLSYARNDLYHQFDQGISLRAQRDIGDFVPSYVVTDSLTHILFTLENVKNYSIDLSTYLNKYIPVLKSSLKISLDLGLSRYQNSLSRGSVRSVHNFNNHLQFFFKTLISRNLIFECDNLLHTSISRVGSEKAFSNTALSVNAKLLYKPTPNIKAYFEQTYVVGNMKLKNAQSFADFTFMYSPIKRPIQLGVSARNVFNKKIITQYMVDDFSQRSFKNSALERSIMLRLAYSF